MKYILLFLLASMTLFADSIGPVTYELPKTEMKWIVGQKEETAEGVTVLYIPEGIDKREGKEFFGVNFNKYKTDIDNLSPLKESLSAMFPTAKIELWPLDKSKNDVLYEWKASIDGKEKLHGWGRGFSFKEGTVLIGYQADTNVSMEYIMSTWMPVLKGARVSGG